VDSDWDRFISRCQQALDDLVEGRPGPFKALWSHADDVVIMGAFGGYERGWGVWLRLLFSLFFFTFLGALVVIGAWLSARRLRRR
jgi:hypothetical protein